MTLTIDQMAQNDPNFWPNGTKWPYLLTKWPKMTLTIDQVAQNDPNYWPSGPKYFTSKNML